MTLPLTTNQQSSPANTESVLARVTQDNNKDGSIRLQIHVAERVSVGGKVIESQWEEYTATYPSPEMMVGATTATWNPSQETLDALAAKIQLGPQEASEAILETYTQLLWGAVAAIKQRNELAAEAGIEE